MVGKTFSIRTGRSSPVLTEHLCSAVMAMREHGDARSAAKELGVTSDSIKTHIQIAESKLKTRLFRRQAGRGHSKWNPIDEARTEAAWGKIRGVLNIDHLGKSPT